MLISYGPCQFPTLGYVVERFQKIESFQREEFWYIYTIVNIDNVKLPLLWARGHLFDKDIV
jgi:DNA topoisomerase-3